MEFQGEVLINEEFIGYITHFDNFSIDSEDYYDPPDYPELNYDFGYAVCEDLDLSYEITTLEINTLDLDIPVEIYNNLEVVDTWWNKEGDGIIIKFRY